MEKKTTASSKAAAAKKPVAAKAAPKPKTAAAPKAPKAPRAPRAGAPAVVRDGQRRRITGVVVSTKMQQTAVVRVDRMKAHPIYGKRYRVSKKFHAHNENDQFVDGDIVVMEETRPMSKTKRWRIVSKA